MILVKMPMLPCNCTFKIVTCLRKQKRKPKGKAPLDIDDEWSSHSNSEMEGFHFGDEHDLQDL